MAAKTTRFFPDEEYRQRRERVQGIMSQQGLDALLIASPENINYLCGLDHMGYFAYQMLILPGKGDPILVTRAMEKATVSDMVPDVVHIGYSDGAEPTPPPDATGMEHIQEPWVLTMGVPTREIDQGEKKMPSAAVRATVNALSDAGLTGGQLGLEQNSTFLPYAIAAEIVEATPDAAWVNCSGLVDDCRITQSAAELALTREAARISDAMMLQAQAAAGEGVNANEVMAAIYDAMFRRGGTYPGFVPLVRSTRNLDHEHGTWEDYVLQPNDVLFLEMAGCVRRYHAPMGRLVFISEPQPETRRINEVCQDAMLAAAGEIRPGAQAGDVYEAWQGVLNKSGLQSYRRHHCGYSVGIGYPPSWSGSGVPVGLRAHSDMKLREGMVFHLMSWLLRSELGDSFLSDTIVVTKEGCEFLTSVERDVTVRR